MVKFWTRVLFVYLVVNCQFAAAIDNLFEVEEQSRQSLENNSNPQNIIKYLDKLYDAARDKNYDSEARRAKQSTYKSELRDLVNKYTELRYLYEFSKVNRPHIKEKDFDENAIAKINFLAELLKSIRLTDPTDFDSIIYEKNRLDGVYFSCECKNLFSEKNLKELSMQIINTDPRDKDLFLKSKNPMNSLINDEESLRLTLFSKCQKSVAIRTYHKQKKCNDPIIDNILNSGDGVFDGYHKFFGLNKTPPIPTGPLGDCTLQDVNSYAPEVLATKGNATHFIGKGEAALNSPCTLLTVHFKTKPSKSGSETHQLLGLRYRGNSKNNAGKWILKELKASNPDEDKKLKEILKLWRDQNKVRADDSDMLPK